MPALATTGPISVTSPLGTAQSSAGFVVIIPGAPVITSFTPAYGAVGTSVTVAGTDFTGATALRFNGTAATTFAVVSNTQMTATVPVGASTGPITIATALGTGQSTSNFTVVVPPTNDLCTAANLPVLTCGGTVTGTTLGATTTGDPTGSCGGETVFAVGGVFYRFVGTGAAITMAMCGGTNYDSELFVYTGTCGNYTCVTGDDDGCGTTASTVRFTSVSGTPYLVYVSGYGTSQGNFSLSVACTTPPTLTSFTPTSGPVGTAVTLTGTGFTGASAVAFKRHGGHLRGGVGHQHHDRRARRGQHRHHQRDGERQHGHQRHAFHRHGLAAARQRPLHRRQPAGADLWQHPDRHHAGRDHHRRPHRLLHRHH